VNLVRAIGPKVQRVRAEGKVLHCGRQLATAEARLYGPDGTLYAHATTTCLVFEMPAAKSPEAVEGPECVDGAAGPCPCSPVHLAAMSAPA
jgi:hypothetical protein